MRLEEYGLVTPHEAFAEMYQPSIAKQQLRKADKFDRVADWRGFLAGGAAVNLLVIEFSVVPALPRRTFQPAKDAGLVVNCRWLNGAIVIQAPYLVNQKITGVQIT